VGLGIRNWCLGFTVYDSGSETQGNGVMVQGLRVQGLGFGV